MTGIRKFCTKETEVGTERKRAYDFCDANNLLFCCVSNYAFD